MYLGAGLPDLNCTTPALRLVPESEVEAALSGSGPMGGGGRFTRTLAARAQNAALGVHTCILEDGPKEGGEVLEGMYTQGWTTIEESRIRGRSGMADSQVSAAEMRSGPAGIVSKTQCTVLT
jgi:hypothetical protein